MAELKRDSWVYMTFSAGGLTEIIFQVLGDWGVDENVSYTTIYT